MDITGRFVMNDTRRAMFVLPTPRMPIRTMFTQSNLPCTRYGCRHAWHSRGMTDRHRVVVIGSGFGGLFAAKRLKRADVDVTVISRVAHHTFQPLLYQVATGILSQGEIAPATREVLKRQKNATVLLGDVTEIDLRPGPSPRRWARCRRPRPGTTR